MSQYGSNPSHYIHSSYNSLRDAGMSYPRNNSQHNSDHAGVPQHQHAPPAVPPNNAHYPNTAYAPHGGTYTSSNLEYERYMAIAGASMTHGQPMANRPGSAPPHPPTGPPAHTANAGTPGPSTQKQCHHCKTLTTPLWRRDPTTGQPLCNACGLYLQQRHAYRPAELIQAERDGYAAAPGGGPPPSPECTRCHSQETSVWRRDKEGNQVCNACGVYERLRGVPRPVELMQQGKERMKHRPKHS